jgi:two-component system response regulator RegA
MAARILAPEPRDAQKKVSRRWNLSISSQFGSDGSNRPIRGPEPMTDVETISLMETPTDVLVVTAAGSDVPAPIAALAAHGFQLAAAEGFAEARTLIGSEPPDVLITEVRLGEYNGLHLVLRAKAIRPDMAALVCFEQPDVVLEREAVSLGATVLIAPIGTRDLVAAVYRTLHRAPDALPISPPFERRVQERRHHSTAVVEERRSADRRRRLLMRSFSTMYI